MSGRAEARVLVVGVGGLGCPAGIALALGGVGTLGLVDDDEVDRSNLHRQILFDDVDVGRPKVEAASRALQGWAPGLRVVPHATRPLPDNAVDLVSRYDLVLEGADNFATKFLTADACAIAAVPVVHAAGVRWHGTVLAVGAKGRPCYRCLFEDLPRGHAPNCAEAGVMGPVVGVLGALAAELALSTLDGLDVAGTLVTFDGRVSGLRRRTFAPRASCDLCGRAAKKRSIDPSRYAGDACGAEL